MIDHYDGNIPPGNTPPHESRGFIHKRIGRGVSRFVTSGFNPLAAGAAFLSPSQAKFTPPPPRPTQLTVRGRLCFEGTPGCTRKAAGLPALSSALSSFALPSFIPCVLPFRRDPRTGDCRIFAGDQSGRDDTPVGDAVMGRYGAALTPGSQIVDRAVCLRGMLLGDDGLCYNRGQITNKQRAWPKGRKPLLTGGEMRAISIAATAGRRLERTAKRLQKIGLMKKPAPRRIKSGPTEHHHHT